MKPTELAEFVIDMAELRGRVEAMTDLEAGRFWTGLSLLAAAAKELVDSGKEALIERLMAGLPVHAQTAEGTFPLRAVPDKKTTCNDARETFLTMLELIPANEIADYLTTQPFKPAMCERVLGERWREHFTREEKLKLTQSGKPVPKRVLALGREGIDEQGEDA